jgi:phospholipase C
MGKTKNDADVIRNAQALLPPVSSFKSGLSCSRVRNTIVSALPYILHSSAKVDVATKTVKLMFSNTGTHAAVFHVYDKLNLDAIPRRYMVEAGK